MITSPIKFSEASAKSLKAITVDAEAQTDAVIFADDIERDKNGSM